MLEFRVWVENQITLAPFEGSPNEEFQAANLMLNGVQVGRINFGIHKVFKGVVDGELTYRVYGTIDDVHLSNRARGTNAMRYIYPVIEKRLQQSGAEYIKLNTVDDPVAQKVWQPLGFELSGQMGGTKAWVKSLV